MTRCIAPLLVIHVAVAACSQPPTHRVAAEVAEQVLASQDGEFVVDPDGGVVLGRDAVAALSNPCSRGFPVGLTGYWVPTAGALRDLESRLPQSLARDVPVLSRPLNVKRIVIWRQYVGLYRSGVRVIYVSGMPSDSLERHQVLWRRGHLHVCGGGALHFGIVYDTATKQFDSFEGNGPM